MSYRYIYIYIIINNNDNKHRYLCTGSGCALCMVLRVPHHMRMTCVLAEAITKRIKHHCVKKGPVHK